MTHRIDGPVETKVSGSTVELRKGQAPAPGGSSPAEPAPPTEAEAKLRAFAKLEKLQELLRGAPVKSVSLDFANAPDAAAVAKLAEARLSQGDNLHSLFRFLACAGVEVAWAGTYKGPFLPADRDLRSVDFGNKPYSPELAPFAQRLQQIVARTKQLAAGLAADGKVVDLRSAAVEESRLAQQLISISIDLSGRGGTEAARLSRASLEAIGNLAELHSRVFYAMTDYVENTKRTLGLVVEGSWPVIEGDGPLQRLVFRNTFRGERLPPEQRDQKLREAWEKFRSKGGVESDIQPLGKSFIDKLENGELAEFVVTVDGEYNVSNHPEIKHSLLAGEKDADTAGGFRVWKNEKGELALCVLSCKSGHFRPTEESLSLLKQRLVELGIPAERIVVSAGDFSDPSTVLAIDIWRFKESSGGEMSKQQGDAFFVGYEQHWKQHRDEGAALVAQLKEAAK